MSRAYAAYRKQTVEITLGGSKGAFENVHIGTLMRRVPVATLDQAGGIACCVPIAELR